MIRFVPLLAALALGGCGAAPAVVSGVLGLAAGTVGLADDAIEYAATKRGMSVHRPDKPPAMCQPPPG